MLGIKDEPEEEIIRQCLIARRAGVDLIHFDVVGGGGKKTTVIETGSADTSAELTPALLAKMKRAAREAGISLAVDVHIMDMQPAYATVRQWLLQGADCITIHWEAFRDKSNLKGILQFISTHGAKGGIALRPDTDIAEILKFIEENPTLIGMVSQAGVLPCLGGQVLHFGILKNLRALRELRQRSPALSYEIMVDGGIEPEIAGPRCFWEGTDILVGGTAFFGRGGRDQETLLGALKALKVAAPLPETNLYDVIADRIVDLRQTREGKLWIGIDGYHGSGKTFTAERIREKLLARGVTPVVVGLDLSWTDRSLRARWKEEAERQRGKGLDHNYYHPLRQVPEPMHWRMAHSSAMLRALDDCRTGTVEVDGCYQFNLMGGADGKVSFRIASDSVIIVEGVYISELGRNNWDLRIYIDADPTQAKEVAIVRDVIKVRRSAAETRQLYEEVYEAAYQEYVARHHPLDAADLVISHRELESESCSWKPSVVDARPPLLLLRCTHPACGEQGPVSRVNACCRCGHELRNEIVGAVDFLKAIDESYRNMWRYRRLLPVRPENIVTDQEGSTPVRFLEKTSRALGVNVWAKMEIENPTGTFKDREASYVLSCSKQFGGSNLVMQSTGNTAIAIAHYAGLAGIASWCFIPRKSIYKLLMPRKAESSRIIAVDGHPIDVKAVAEDFSACFAYPKISPFYERCEANKTMGYEVAECLLRDQVPEQGRLRGSSFDFYVQTLSAGMGLIGFHAAMACLQEWTRGRIKVPRIVAVEISEFAPIQKAWEMGLEQVGEEVATPFFPEHALFEPTLWTTNVRKYYPHLRRMLQHSNGILDAVTPGEVRAAIDNYGIAEEVRSLGHRMADTENASFIGFAGLAKKVRSGEIPKGANVILMLTGKGFRESYVQELPDFVVDPKLHKPFDILRGASAH